MLIAFTGAHSTGKSTLLQKCKELEVLKDYTFVDEVTRKIQRDYNVTINDTAPNYDYVQTLIMADHIKNAKLTNAVLDRSALDGCLYTRYLYRRGKVGTIVRRFANEMYNELFFKYDIVFYTDPNIPLEADGVRSVDPEFRTSMVEMFEEEMSFLDNYSTKPVTWKPAIVRVKGNIDERMAIIKDTLTKKL
jgi:nicotinamide riboside kinase